MGDNLVIEVKNISKSFTSTRALSHVDLQVFSGEIRGLIGENGSGKSTLSAIISGNLKADEGEMYLFGEPYAPQNSFDASCKGISMIVQEQGTIDTVSVAANIFAGREEQFCKYGLLDSKGLTKAAQELLEKVGIGDIRAEQITGTLSFEDKKLVEIARAFYKTPELFIVDETTTALPQKGREILYRLIRQLKKEGKSVLFISHDIEELMDVCDTVTILRDGQLIASLSEDEMDPHKMKSLMVGREVVDNYYRNRNEPASGGKGVLEVKGVSSGILKNINFVVKEGEILGFAGLSDCGMHELCKVLFGLVKPETGSVLLKGKTIANTKEAIRNRMGFMSKNRDTESMLITLSIQENVVLPSLPRLRTGGFFIFPSSERKLAQKWCEILNVKMRDLDQPCAELSGGNKQKIVLAKWLANDSDIFVLDCPTRGIDIGVKEAIYRIMENLKKEGKSIIMVSEELPEVIGMSDRILVMKDGEITGSFTRSTEMKETDVIQYMI
jgi:ribose transport system ATP-binding protein